MTDPSRFIASPLTKVHKHHIVSEKPFGRDQKVLQGIFANFPESELESIEKPPAGGSLSVLQSFIIPSLPPSPAAMAGSKILQL